MVHNKISGAVPVGVGLGKKIRAEHAKLILNESYIIVQEQQLGNMKKSPTSSPQNSILKTMIESYYNDDDPKRGIK